MSESPVEAPATEALDTAPTTAEPAPTPKPTETLEFWKQKAREQENRAKSNSDKAKQYDEFQQAQMSEQEKLSARAEAAERAARDAASETLRYKAAATFRIDPDHFDLLGSGTEDEIHGRAERLGELLSAREENVQLKAELEALKAGRPSPSGRPVESLKPGATPTEVSSMDDAYPASWARQGRSTN